jgi:hypothetical protein
MTSWSQGNNFTVVQGNSFKILLQQYIKRGSPVHIAPACAGSREGSPTTLGLMYAVFPCISASGCFQDLNS